MISPLSQKPSIPLVVDLDGSLISTDMLHESTLHLLFNRPLRAFQIPRWLINGKASLKKNLASGFIFDPSTLPYREDLIDWLRQQSALGRTLILCTATDDSIAVSISKYLGFFEEVIASDGRRNLAGRIKSDILVDRFGHHGFDYVGNSKADLHVWLNARKAIVINAGRGLVSKVTRLYSVECIFPRKCRGLSAWLRMLRAHQWLKNLLLFVPLFAAHEIDNLTSWHSLILAFFSFSICASSVYVINDLVDLESDRAHPRKRFRPLASGLFSVWIGILIAPILFLISLWIGSLVGDQFLNWLVLYIFLTTAYTWFLKRLILIDCIVLALLYTIRVLAGAAAVGHNLSFWLLAFSVFLFLSLAFVKRYAELEIQIKRGKEKIQGRGYLSADAPLIQTIGVAGGYASVLVLALYLNSDAVIKLYRAPEVIWGVVPVMLFWVSWMWMQAHRGNMHDDPLIFAIKDRVSLAAGALFALIILVGTKGLVW